MTETASRPKPARRASPDDPVAGRIRQRRLGLGWSFKRLSEATSGLAPSFLFNIECGRKVPSEDVAARIAHALEDGAFEATYRAWARAKSRGRTGRMDHEAMLRAWEQLRNPFGSPRRRPDPCRRPRQRAPAPPSATAADCASRCWRRRATPATAFARCPK